MKNIKCWIWKWHIKNFPSTWAQSSVAGNHVWLAPSLDCRTDHKFNAVKMFFEIRVQVLIKQNGMLDVWMTYFSWNIYYSFTDMSAMGYLFDWTIYNWHWVLTTGEKVKKSTLQNKLFEIRAQVLIKQNIFLDI